MGFLRQAMGIPEPPKGGNGNGGDKNPKPPPSKEQDKTDKRRWYEKQVEDLENEDPPDEPPRDGKLW